MIRRYFITLLVLLPALQVLGQQKSGLVRSGLKAIANERWAKAKDKLSKSVRKDSLNSFAHYGVAAYYFAVSNPEANLDNSYDEIIRSAKLYPLIGNKGRARLSKNGFDSTRIHLLRKAIDSATFHLVKQKNVEDEYVGFLKKHPYAEQREEAIALRDEVAFLDAVNKNTYESFQSYLKKYPQSAYAQAAQRRYDKLIYESMTREGTLQAYEKFLNEHPNTPFRKESETSIFELYTLSGDVAKFQMFITRYPRSHEVKRSKDILFHLFLERDAITWPAGFLNDSLQNVLNLQQHFLVPFLKASRFGFMNRLGKEVIPPITEELGDEYQCGNISEDILVLPGKIISRNKATVFNGNVSSVEDIGAGFLSVEQTGCKLIVHKSGFVVDSCVNDASVLGHRFLSLTKEGKKFLTSLPGRRILAQPWQDIMMFGSNVCGFRAENSWNLLTLKEVEEYSQRGNRLFARSYQEARPLPDGNILVKNENGQGVLNQQLDEVIPVTSHIVQKTFFGFIALSENGYSIYSDNSKRSSFYDLVKVREPWIAVSKNGERLLLNPSTHQFLSKGYDSIFFEGPFAIATKADSTIIHFPSLTTAEFGTETDVRFIPGKDSTAFLLVSTLQPVPQRRGRLMKTEEVQILFNSKGRKLFTEKFDDIQVAGSDLFILSRKEKKALIDGTGKILLPFEFDAIGTVNDETISLLRSMKFGLYDVRHQKLIKPDFDKNVARYHGENIVAYRDGLYGIVQWDKLRELRPEFEEVKYWNDTVALVRKNQRWSLFDIAEKKFIETDLETVKMIRDDESEKIAIVERDRSYGVLSNKRGTIIPISFSDLVNVGSAEEPLYFTEKHVPEASIFVVMYYDENGKLIRREIYENPDDYEKIYCGGR